MVPRDGAIEVMGSIWDTEDILELAFLKRSDVGVKMSSKGA